MVRAVFLDVGETLINEDRYWREAARIAGIEPHAVTAALGFTIARAEEHGELWRRLGIERPAVDGLVYTREDMYADALPCLEALRSLGYRLGLSGNQTAALEEWARRERFPVDVIGSSATWGVRKPSPAFFERVIAEAAAPAAEIAYVGDRSDNDIEPALAAGMIAVHLRRGPWGRLQATPAGAIAIESLAELPGALASLA